MLSRRFRTLSGHKCFSLLGLLLFGCPAYAGTIFFTPAGTQLDGDPILDIATAPGLTVTFDIFLSTGNLSAPLGEFNFRLQYDNVELQPIGLGFRDSLFPGSCQTVIATNPFGTAITGGYTGCNLPANTLVQMGTSAFTVLPGLNNDNASDFSAAITSARSTVGADVSGQFLGQQVVEVQPEMTPEPASLLLLATGLAVGGVVARRQRPGS